MSIDYEICYLEISTDFLEHKFSKQRDACALPQLYVLHLNILHTLWTYLERANFKQTE